MSLGVADGSFADTSKPWDLRFGPSLVGVTDELADTLDRASVGLDAGASVRWPHSLARFSLQGELLLARRLRSFEDVVAPSFSGIGSGMKLRRALLVLYAQVPLLARACLRQEGVVRPYALAGPYVGWRLSSRITPGRHVGDEPIDPGDVRPVDFGVIVGIGAQFVGEKSTVALEARVEMGGVDVLEDRAGVEGAYRVLSFLLAFTP